MPGGWTMSTMWMRMPGQTWSSATVSFLAMWAPMMAAMMLPSLLPILWRYRQALSIAGKAYPGLLTMFVGAGYFSVWTALGILTFPTGVALARIEMLYPELARAVPMAVCAVVLIGGAFQFTEWKARYLACCREIPGGGLAANPGAALRDGLRLGLNCSYSCAGLTAILLVSGVMDPAVMAATTASITVERLAPAGERFARAIGAVVIGAGVVLIARTVVIP